MAGGGRHTRGRGGGNPPGPGNHRIGSPGGEDPCDIRFETILNSIAPLSLQSVTRGNILKLAVDSQKSPPRLEASQNGVFVGVISHPKTLDVIGCIGQGNEYVAIVLERQANLCKVKVERQAR